ncbi:MAG: cytochrome c biogenesis protein CcsA [Chitinophagales bacterium]
MNVIKKILDRLFSTSAAGLYMLLFAAAIGIATFIENDFGTSSAQKVIFKARWFELLLILFGISLLVNIARFRMVQQKKWAVLTFHASIIIILLGAGVTRYFGSEGMMGIREGGASNHFLSSDMYLQFQVLNGEKKYSFEEAVLFASLGDNTFNESYLIGNQEIRVNLDQFIPNPKEVMEESENGIPTLKVVIGAANGREEFLVRYGDKVDIYGTLFNFGNQEDPAAFNIKYEDEGISFLTSKPFVQMVMATQKRDTLAPGIYHPLLLRSLYSDGEHSFVFGDFSTSATANLVSSDQKMTSTSLGGLKLKVAVGGQEKSVFIAGKQGVEGRPAVLDWGQTKIAVAYGARKVELPFSIKLRDFILERYPGTDNASSYASEVTLIDERKNLRENQRIYMNNILNYGGYRFFQSSFDQDELGTYLSVNHDAPGTLISYIGYFLLTLGMVLTLFDRSSRFQQLAQNISKIRQKTNGNLFLLLFVCIGLPSFVRAGPTYGQPSIKSSHAQLFGTVLTQDHHGRLKPMNTFANEVLRKLSRKETFEGLTGEQVLLGMASNPKAWYNAPIIKIGNHEEIRNILQISGKMASYNDFFLPDGSYKLKEVIRKAFNTAPRDRGVFEKELIKIDEKINICSMIFSGRFMKVFPIPGDSTNTWQTPPEGHSHTTSVGTGIVANFYRLYIPALQAATQNNDWSLPDKMVNELKQYQQKNGGTILPSSNTVKAELLLNKMDVFNRLGKLYGINGLLFLALLFTGVFKPKVSLKKPALAALGLLVFGFVMHTIGLGLRWYISGRAPWSNGYESMIYIGWTTVLAGLLFARKSPGGLAATSVLAATIMMVAGLSWLDPEITPLVPVLKSYWLTIHVSLEAGSYGFLVLGAIIGVLNLILMITANQKNGENSYRIIKEMSYISEMTLIGGLFMISIGTYLGGVWANESWGRYWGWDAKETWALVTILVYSFILHMRFIPGLRGLLAFNVATLFGWASVAMTYFGVNYYLSGLHSYAAGDPVPVPSFVYYIVFSLIIISLVAWWKFRQYHQKRTA